MVDTPTVERLGRYRLLRRLGRGGMATVYHAVQEGPHGFENEVAVKVVHPELLEEHPFLLENLVDEARIAARIRHPNVVRILDLVEEGERFYLVMDYVDGVSMRQVLDAARTTKTRPPVAPVLEVLAGAARGLDAAHRLVLPDGTHMGLVHRDVKPGNILVSHDGQVKVSDFGVALFGDRITESTMTGQMKGTPAYMSPEQALGDPVTGRADIFSLGVTLYTLLTTKLVHQAESAVRLAMKIATEPLDDQAAELEALVPGLGSVFLRACAKIPEDRYGDVNQLAVALDAVRATRQSPTSIAEMVASTGWKPRQMGIAHYQGQSTDLELALADTADLALSLGDADVPSIELDDSLVLDNSWDTSGLEQDDEDEPTVAGALAPTHNIDRLGPLPVDEDDSLDDEPTDPGSPALVDPLGGDVAALGRPLGRVAPAPPPRPAPPVVPAPEPPTAPPDPNTAPPSAPAPLVAPAPKPASVPPEPNTAPPSAPQPGPAPRDLTTAPRDLTTAPPDPNTAPPKGRATDPLEAPADDPEMTPPAGQPPPSFGPAPSSPFVEIVVPDPAAPHIDMVIPPAVPPPPFAGATGRVMGGPLGAPPPSAAPLPGAPKRRRKSAGAKSSRRSGQPAQPARDYRGRAVRGNSLGQNTSIGRAEKIGVAVAFFLLLLAVATIVGLQVLRPTPPDHDPRVVDANLPAAGERVVLPPVQTPPPAPPKADGSVTPPPSPPPEESPRKAGDVIEPAGSADAKPGELVPGAVVEHETKTLNDRAREAAEKKKAAARNATRKAESAESATPTPPPAAAPGTLVVNSYPWSKVFVDGVEIGTTPVRGHSLPAGPHEVKLVFPSAGAVEHVQSIDVESGRKSQVIKKLDPS